MCVEDKIIPRDLYMKHIKKLQQILLKQDGSIIGIKMRTWKIRLDQQLLWHLHH